MMHKILSVLFPAIMVLIGTVDLTQPEAVKVVFNSVGMPDYMMVIVGIGKVAGGLVLLLRVPLVLKEWAFAGFFIWLLQFSEVAWRKKRRAAGAFC